MLLSTLFSEPISFFAAIFSLIVGITVHEFSHAFAAHRLGDPTPGQQGRLSLNPLKHLDFFGTLFLLVAGFGWGKPVQFNPAYLKNPRSGSVIIGFAGPAANLIMVIVFGVILRVLAQFGVLSPESGLFVLLSSLVLMNLVLLVFNLIPIPPLDGSKAVLALITPRYNEFATWLVRTGPFLLLGLIILDSFSPVSILGNLFGFMINLTFNIVFG